jgi:hypothetical protein
VSLVDDAVIRNLPSLEELLDFEVSAPPTQWAKGRAIRDTFGISLVRYTQLLTKVLDWPEAFAHSPILVGRLRRLRDERRALRFGPPEPAPTRPDPRQRELPSRPHREGAQVTPPANDVEEEQLSGEDYKQLGMNMAEAFADDEWKDRVDRVIRDLAARGLPFNAETVREIAGDPPGHANAFGGRFYAAAHKGIIVKTGYANATRPSLHSHPIATWVGAESEHR